jgi:hypothetical protein
MTWTYGGDPDANDRDEVRFLVGDTDTTDQQITDEEIAYCVSKGGGNYMAAALASEAIAASYARDVDVKNGPAQEWASQRYKHYKDKATELRKRGGAFVKPIFGGQSLADKDSLNSDSDVPQPYFRRGMSDMAGGQSHLDGGASDDETVD